MTKVKPIKKQSTHWIFWYKGAKGTGMHVGWIHNKNKGVLGDRVRVWILSASMNQPLDMNMRIDEALALICGLGKVLATEAIAHNIEVKE